MRVSDDNLRGRTVISSDGIAVGEIAALSIDSGTWDVASLQVKLRKDVAERLGAEHGLFRAGATEIPTTMVQSLGDAVILSVAVDELRRVLRGTSGEAVVPGE